ncbi:MAG: ABC transporter ATP-binding protein [Microbacterium sp.]
MPEGQVLEFSGVTKRFGGVSAVSDFTARVEPGLVTGFLGPNGAGKTTSLRILLGLVGATSGRATIGGVPYAKLREPLQTVGAVLEASSFHPGRTAANHLRVYARAARISDARVDEVLGLVGLSDAAGRKVGGFSLGMRQRLGLAYALLGDPGVLVLDEPANGLDPEGIRWMRGFLRQLAREGRTVLISSHLLTEVQQTVDSLLVISQGRLVFQGGLDELADPSEYATVVDAPDRAALVAALADADVPYEVLRSGVTVRNLLPAEIGVIAADAGVALSSLQRKGPALEEVFLELVSGARVHASASGAMAPVVVADVDDVPAADTPPVEQDAVVEPVADDTAEAAEPDAPELVEEAAAGEDAAPGAAQETETAEDAETADGESGAAAGAAAAFATSADGQTVATGSTPAVESAPLDLESPHAFAVATTGVIDVVPPSATWSDGAADDAAPPTGDDAVPEGFAADDVFPEAAPAAPLDADPDVEQIGEVDEELEAPAPENDTAPAEDRPFDTYDKTDSDVHADAFFAAFDDGTTPAQAEPDASADGPEPTETSESSERTEETEKFGSLVDPDPEWAERDADHRDDHEGGEQR